MSSTPAAEPLVSVIVPTYQHAAFITECLDSILGQRTSFAVEVLIGEDGSDDGTRETCQRYADQYPDRIRLFLNDRRNTIFINGSPTGRWNVMNLYAHCRGRYIAICEGDDRWTGADKLERQVRLMEEDPTCAGTFHATRIIEHDGTDTGRLMRTEMKERMEVEDLIAPIAPFHTSSFVFRNAPLIRQLPAWARYVGSLDLTVFVLVAGAGTLRRVDGVMSAYRKHAGGVTAFALHQGASFHHLRLLLWLNIDKHFGWRYAAQFDTLFLLHWRQILELSSRGERVRYLTDMLRKVPAWFVRRPVFTLRRWREALFA